MEKQTSGWNYFSGGKCEDSNWVFLKWDTIVSEFLNKCCVLTLCQNAQKAFRPQLPSPMCPGFLEFCRPLSEGKGQSSLFLAWLYLPGSLQGKQNLMGWGRGGMGVVGGRGLQSLIYPSYLMNFVPGTLMQSTLHSSPLTPGRNFWGRYYYCLIHRWGAEAQKD